MKQNELKTFGRYILRGKTSSDDTVVILRGKALDQSGRLCVIAPGDTFYFVRAEELQPLTAVKI